MKKDLLGDIYFEGVIKDLREISFLQKEKFDLPMVITSKGYMTNVNMEKSIDAIMDMIRITRKTKKKDWRHNRKVIRKAIEQLVCE